MPPPPVSVSVSVPVPVPVPGERFGNGIPKYIGIDDAFPRGHPPHVDDVTRDAESLQRLFPEVYLRLHRRIPREDRVTPQSWAVLHHLAMSGPLTVSEMARHLDRAQSVVTEIIDGLEARGLLARMRDEKDRRRTFVWLTDAAHAFLAREREVLDHDRLASALRRMDPSERSALVRGLEAIVQHAVPRSESQKR